MTTISTPSARKESGEKREKECIISLASKLEKDGGEIGEHDPSFWA